MTANGKQESMRLGFLTAIEVPDKGFVGGLLVTNNYGRPLEFQCTAPIKANSTQEILYGPTLAPFILGELIGATLVEKAGVKPQLILTDQAQILELRNHIDRPVALVEKGATESNSDEPGTRKSIKFGRQIIQFHPAHSGDQSTVSRDSQQVPADADLQ